MRRLVEFMRKRSQTASPFRKGGPRLPRGRPPSLSIAFSVGRSTFPIPFDRHHSSPLSGIRTANARLLVHVLRGHCERYAIRPAHP